MTISQICRSCKKAFSIEDQDLSFYKKIDVPSPTRCPQCRLIRRLNERNAKNLYYRKCSFTGQKIISPYHEDRPFPVYSNEIWWSDKWDALEYGMDFDFKRSFFEQFKELKNKTPHFASFIIGGTMENSDFTNCTGYLKNCYLLGEADYNEDCYYSNRLNNCKNVVDCSFCYESELLYECTDCMNCYNLLFSRDCENCRDSAFLSNCQACKDCIGCINQRHKTYMIFNKQFSKEQYAEKKKEFEKKKCEEFFKTQPHKALQAEHNENCLGNRLYNSKNSFYCFDSKDLEDCKYCSRLSLGVKNSMDYNSWGMKAELIYECSACGDNIYNLKFCSTCTTGLSDCEYCDQCTASHDIFGCIGLKRKQYCILNKQYSADEYFSLRKKIIEHMKEKGEYGEYFPIDICPFGYNETIAMEYFPLTKEQALSKGYKWRDPDPKEFQPPAKDILACEQCKRNYKIIPQELKLYKMLSVPVPGLCPACRHARRVESRDPPILYQRKCAKCAGDIQTTYSPDRPEIVYCEKCYLESVY